MSHNSALREHATTAAREAATENDPIRLAFSAMATGIKIPKSVAWRLYDSKRGRVAQPLGSYPEVAEACIDSGGSIHYILRPLTAMAAHVKRRMRGKLPQDMKPALITMNKRESESDVSELNLALSCANPDTSELLDFVKNKREEILAEEHAVELAEELLAAREQK